MSATTPTIRGSYLMPSLTNATVADAMHPGVITCDPDAAVADVARMMATHHVHCIAVMGVSRQHGESLSWGIISDLDLVRAGIDSSERLAATMAGGVPVSVEPGTPLREAAQMMLAHLTPHLLVIEPRTQRPVGILSTLDIAGILAWGEA
jgi:CBS domain-containing protein